MGVFVDVDGDGDDAGAGELQRRQAGTKLGLVDVDDERMPAMMAVDEGRGSPTTGVDDDGERWRRTAAVSADDDDDERKR